MNPLALGKRELIFPAVLPDDAGRTRDGRPMAANEAAGAAGVGLRRAIWAEAHLEAFLLRSVGKFIGAHPRTLLRCCFARC